MMNELPIDVIAFSPAIGGVECYVLIKENGKITILEAHEEEKYKQYIGRFKKPDTGMFAVLSDIASEKFNLSIDHNNSFIIGDTWEDEHAAKSFGLYFIPTSDIHQKS